MTSYTKQEKRARDTIHLLVTSRWLCRGVNPPWKSVDPKNQFSNFVSNKSRDSVVCLSPENSSARKQN